MCLKILIHTLYEPGQSILFPTLRLKWIENKTGPFSEDHFYILVAIHSASNPLLNCIQLGKGMLAAKVIRIIHRNKEVELRLLVLFLAIAKYQLKLTKLGKGWNIVQAGSDQTLPL